MSIPNIEDCTIVRRSITDVVDGEGPLVAAVNRDAVLREPTLRGDFPVDRPVEVNPFDFPGRAAAGGGLDTGDAVAEPPGNLTPSGTGGGQY